MRIGLLVAGIVLIVLGAVLLFVPVVPLQSQTVTSTSPDIFNVTTAFSPTGNLQLALTWSSATSTTFAVFTCGTINLAAHNVSGICRGLSIIGFQNGTSGSFNFGTKVGSKVFAGIVSQRPGTASVNVSGTSPIIATLLIVLGLVLAIVGVALKKKVRAAAAPAPRTTETAPSDDDASSSSGS
jgi:uncharacterized membrane protein